MQLRCFVRTARLAMVALVSVAVMTPALAAAQTVLYDDFEPGDTFSAQFAYGVDGQDQWQAFRFVPTTSGFLDQLTVALGRSGAAQTSTVFTLYDGSSPTTLGPLIESFVAVNSATPDPTAPFTAVLVTLVSTLRPKLMAGRGYWLSFSDPEPGNGASSFWCFSLFATGNRLTGPFPPQLARLPAFRAEGKTWNDLAVDFGPGVGLWTVRDGPIWNPVHGLSPESMVTGDLDGDGLDDLIANFGPGIGVYAWMNHATWQFLHPSSPSRMVTGDLDNNQRDEVVFVFPGFGLYRWNDGSWSQLHGLDANHLAVGDLDNATGDELLVSFAGYGLFAFDDIAGWSLLHPFEVAKVETADLDNNGADDVIVEFVGAGLFSYVNQTTWAQVHPFSPAHVAAGDLDNNGVVDLVIDFGSGVGIYVLRNGTTWAPLHPFPSEGLVLADVDDNGIDEIVIDFGAGIGLWAYVNDGAWELLHGLSPESIAAGRFH